MICQTATVYLKTCSKCPSLAFAQARSLLIQSCWWSSVVDHPILFARLSSARQCYLVKGLKCAVALKQSSAALWLRGLRSVEFGGHSSFYNVQFSVLFGVFRHDRAISQSLHTQRLDSQFIVHGNFTHDSWNQLTSGYTYYVSNLKNIYKQLNTYDVTLSDDDWREMSGLNSFKNLKNLTSGCENIAYCLVGYFILSQLYESILATSELINFARRVAIWCNKLFTIKFNGWHAVSLEELHEKKRLTTKSSEFNWYLFKGRTSKPVLLIV